MSTNRFGSLLASALGAPCALLVGLIVCGWSMQLPLAAMQSSAPQSLRLYVFDCGYLFNVNPETFNLTRQDVPDPTAPVSCYLVVHPKGTLIFDTGLGDKLVGRPPYLTKRGAMSQVVLKTLSSQLR
jgi:N-acyl homoserine lactone hydrolase